jgi:Chaperone of endosialidase
MTTAYTSLLGLALPVTGELSGTWGTTVNDAITSLLDSAIAGTTTISSDADVTLTTTTGAANTSREAILLWTAGGTVTRNITAPAQSKTYIVINKSSSTQSIVLRGVGPTTGVTIVQGESAVCAWNGSDFIKVSNISGAGSFTNLSYTGTLTGGTGIVNLGSGQFYKDASGNVGIGNTSPGVKLQVTGNTIASNFYNGTGTASAGTFGADSAGTGASIVMYGSTGANPGAMLLNAGGSERMRIDSSGNVGIGTATPVAQLGVYGAGQTTAAMSTSSGLGGTLYVRDSVGVSGNGGAVMFGASQGAFAAIKGLITDGSNNTLGALAFSNRNASTDATLTERMRIDPNGNVGIGTTSPAYKLDVNGDVNVPANSSYFIGANADRYIKYRSSQNDVLYSGYSGLFYQQAIASTYHAWFTGNNERMRIDSSGNVFLNCTSSPTSNSTAVINAIASGGDGINLKHTVDGNNMLNLWQTGTTTYAAITFNKGNTQTSVGTISVSTTATAYNTSSDYRLKQDIAPITGALAKVAALKPVTYKWKLDGSDSEGFIAHELAEVCPHAVTGTKDAVYKDGNPKYQGIDTSFLVATLTAAIQEQQALITSLTARISALETN